MRLRPPILDTLSATQTAALRWTPPRPANADDVPYAQVALLGWYGSGKTTLAALRLLRHAAANPWTPSYGMTNPTTVVCGPTLRVLNRATKAVVDKLFPPELVLRRRGTPHNDILLANGHLLVLWSAEAPLEGVTLTGLWVDEVSHPIFDGVIWTNLVSRVRDPLAPELTVIVSGLPETGFVQDTFRGWCDSPGPGQYGALLATNDNPIMRGNRLAAIAEATSYEDRELLTKPGWRPNSLAVYPSFDPAIHVLDVEGDPRRVVHMGIDVGSTSAVVLAQDHDFRHAGGNAKGALVVAEHIIDSSDLDEVCRIVKASHFAPGPGSTISVDPTIRELEYNCLRRHFPGARVIQRTRAESFYDVEEGITNVRRVLRDALGNVSVGIARSLQKQGDPRGVVHALAAYKRLPSGRLPKNSAIEHVADALRYCICTMVPLLDADRQKPRVMRRAS